MNQLRNFIQSSENEDFKFQSECKKIIQTGKQEEFEELCKCLKQFLDNDLKRHVSQFSILLLCLMLITEKNQVFNFVHFQNIVLPVIVQYIYNNQMYSKELPPKTQQYIKSSITVAQEILSYLAHVYPQTQDLQYSQFLIEYQLFKRKQKEKFMPLFKKKKCAYIKDFIAQIHSNYKQIKLSWKKSLDEEQLFQTHEIKDNGSNQTKATDDNDQKNQEQINLQKRELSKIEQQIIERKREQYQLIQEINSLKVERSQLEAEIESMKQNQTNYSQPQISKQEETKSTNRSESITKNPSFFQQGKLIFDEEFQLENHKIFMLESNGKNQLCKLDTSYPDKKKRFFDGRGFFHIQQDYQLARDFKLNQNTIDIAIYLKCVKKRISDLDVLIQCDKKYEKYSNLQQNKNLNVGKQVLFEIRNIPKQQLLHQDIKIDIIIDSQEIVREEVSFYLKITNIVSYKFKTEEDLIKEYQEIKKLLFSENIDFDIEVFPNGLVDVQKCIQHSIIYKQRQLFVAGSITEQPFILRITLDEKNHAEVTLKGLEFNDEIASRLIQTYIDVLQK